MHAVWSESNWQSSEQEVFCQWDRCGFENRLECCEVRIMDDDDDDNIRQDRPI